MPAVGDTLMEKEVTVQFENTEVVSRTGVVVAVNELGILLRRPYRKGVRLELIPRDLIRGVFHEVEKGPRRKRGAEADLAEEPEADDLEDDGLTEDSVDDVDDDDEDDFEDEPNTEWEEDDE